MTTYFIIKMYPQIEQPQLEFLTGGWMPVIQIVKDQAAICIFTTLLSAEDYKSAYSQLSVGHVKSLEVISVNVEAIRRFKLISDKLTLVSINPSIHVGQFFANNIKTIDEFDL